MSIVKGAIFVAPAFFVCVAFAQTTRQFDYCRALTSTYRNAVGSGAAPMQKLEAATIECSTNPTGSIPVIERGLKEMKVELPSRG